MFQKFYESPLQHPWLLVLVPLAFGGFILFKRGFIARALLVFTVLSILDPLINGPGVELLSIKPGLAQALAILFVILGDFRWFFFVEVIQDPNPSFSRVAVKSVMRALAFSFIVPIIQALAIQVWPDILQGSRMVFLVYETLFLILTLFYLLFRVPREPIAVRSFKRRLVGYALAYYLLWVCADLVILTGTDYGYLLRIVPNQLYYSFFLPFVWWSSVQVLRANTAG